MLYFENDYSEGAHPAVLEALVSSNMEKLSGYGTDTYSEQAKEKIRAASASEDADVYLLVGGTQTNTIVIKAMLAVYEGVIAADTGHISTHEAGAIEATGHKVLTMPHQEGKILPEQLQDYLVDFYADGNHSHMVYPGMVYISHPTEYGTLYSKDELQQISTICREYDIPLFLDGARLAYGVAAEESDVDLPTIAKYCDVFYIGATKVGALCGEAIVFPKPATTPAHFTTIIKQHGGLLAKGRLLGVQFDALFSNNLYFDMGKHALTMAQQLKEAFRKKKYRFYIDSPTNQIFIILNNQKLADLAKKVRFSFWEKHDDQHTIVRFATSWATEQSDVDALIDLL